MVTSYQKKRREGHRGEVQDALEAYVQEGARKMLVAALEEEVTGFLERLRYQRSKQFRGYRNGYHLPREITVGLGPVEVRVPRIAKVPREVAPQGFQSQIVKRYERASETTKRLFARLYLEGLATGDFEPVFRELVGETTALSPNAIVRLKECWEKEYEAWRGHCGNTGTLILGKTAFTLVPDLRKKRRRCCALWERGRMGKRSCWGWSLATVRVKRAGQRCCGTYVTVVWKRRLLL